MKLWPFRRNVKKGPSVVPFPTNIDELATLKHHGLRALCGGFMDRHSACLSPHPFCGHLGHQKQGDAPMQLIAHIVPQLHINGGKIIAIYLCKAKGTVQASDTTGLDPLEHTVGLTYLERTPNLKMVISLVEGGTYIAQYGPIANPVEGDFSTGHLDRENIRTLYCNPEPAYTRWQYWESTITEGQSVVPEYHCLQVFGEWWIVDVDRDKGRYQHVAALDFADNPEHNWGIHKPGKGYYFNPNDGSEYSQALNENLPRVG